ncbi:MAG: hypothetical protein OEZ08_15385 [Betaproteobacteria bacterium]|nr:hypothetical protein [Betaproteobacteria bacterium]
MNALSIRNALLLKGPGSPPRRGDLAVKNSKIVQAVDWHLAQNPRKMVRTLALLPLLALAACASLKDAPRPADAAAARSGASATDRAKAREAALRDVELERRAARFELELWARDAMVEDLQRRLEDARREVVRAMAKLRTLATRAEAASAMAGAEVALTRPFDAAWSFRDRQA